MAPPKVNENSSMDVAQIFTTLENSCSSHDDKCKAYFSLARYMKEEDGLNNPYVQVRSSQLLNFLVQDSLIQNNDVTKNLLQVLQFYITAQKKSGVAFKESTVLQVLLQTLKEERSDEVNNEILNCLAFQKFQPSVLKSEMPVLIQKLEGMYQKKKVHPDQFIERLVDSVFRLEEQVGLQSSSDVHKFVLLIIHGLVHPSQETRLRSLELITKFKSQLVGNGDLAKNLVKIINTDFSKNLKSFLSKDCGYMTKVWSLLLNLSGKAIHKGSTINTMLQIIEPAFKGQTENRIQAFKAWRDLINNFALDSDVISEPKRIRLVMMVMKVDNAKTEAVAMEKLLTWWHFVTKINTKLSTNFEQIIYPLLQFCAGNNKLHPTSAQHVSSPWMSLSMSSPGKHGPTRGVHNLLQAFPALQKLGCEIAGQILSKTFKGDSPLSVSWTLEPLNVDVFSSPASFVKHAPLVMSAVCELFKNIGSQLEESLVLHIWRSLSNQLRCALDTMKMECRESFSAFLSHLHALVQDDVFSQPLLFKMLLSSCNFTQKILSSTAFNIGGGYVRSCPALLLTEIMFMPVMVKHNNTEQYIKLFSSLVNAGVSNKQGALVFLQAVCDLVDSRVNDLQSSDFLWRLWSTLAHTLHEHITSTNEVNQGDALEYNFGCLFAILILPIKRQLASKVSQTVCKTILRTWKELYHTFARLSALVATAEANTCLEELSSKIIQAWVPDFKDPSALEFLSNVCLKMLDCVDFSALSVSHTPGNSLTLSPSKWAKRRTRPMGNLHSFVHLLAKTQSEINNLLTLVNDKKIDFKQDNLSSSVTASINAMVEVCTRLFSHVTPSLVSHVISSLCLPLSYLYSGNSKAGPIKIFVPSFMAKLEKLWQEIVNCVTGRYNDQYDSYFLGLLSPMLEETFLHSRRGIKSQTLTLWSSTFSKSSSLVYPDNLKIVLCKVKEKTALVLPGWIMTPEQVIAETPFSETSQLSQGDSLIPIPILPGLPSPKRPSRNSFISRDLSPARPSAALNKVSPAKVVSPKEAKALFSSSRKNVGLDLNMMSSNDFVVISSPPKRKRRLLTEHQKEVLKEKRVIPAMYNNLDASVDISLSNFDTQQESLSSMDIMRKPSESLDQFKIQNTRGRSVRIAELKKCESGSSTSLTENEKKTEEEKMDVGDILDISNDGGSPLSRHPKKNSGKVSNEEEKKNNKAISSCQDISSMTTKKDNKTETEPAAFKMFRNQTIEAEHSKTVEEPGTLNSHPRRVSLRKVRSYDIPTSSVETENDSTDADKGKSPRRVPLLRLTEQKSPEAGNSVKPTSVASKGSTKKLQGTSSERKSDKPTTETSDSKKTEKSTGIPENKKNVKSCLDNWLVKGGKKTEDNSSPSTVTNESPPTVFSLSSAQPVPKGNESITLVEDTQSPGKMNRDRNGGQGTHESIAETPPKSEDNSSPSPRTTRSVRKLFTDSETNKQLPNSMSNSDSKIIPESESKLVMKSQSNENDIMKDSGVPLFDSDSVISSSQGFDIPMKMATADVSALASKPEQETEEEEVPNKGEVDTNNQTDYPESEDLLDSPAETPISIDMMMMAMPTLASQSDKVISKLPESSSSAKTTSSDESSNKSLVTSSESDFNPSQSTLKDEESSSVKPKERASVQSSPSKVKKPNACSPEMVSNEKEVTCIEEEPILTAIKPKENPLTAEEEKEVSQFTIFDSEPLIEEDEQKITKEISIIGEVTPDVKSPSESSPIKRSSTTKRRRKAAKRLSEQLNEDIPAEAPAYLTVEEGDDSVMILSSDNEIKMNDILMKTRSPYPLHKKQTDVSSSVSAKSKHLLRTRTKVVRRLSSPPPKNSPPKKRKALKRPQVKSSPEDTDDIPLSSLKKRKVTFSKSGSDVTTDDEDKPLASLINHKKDSHKEAIESNRVTKTVIFNEKDDEIITCPSEDIESARNSNPSLSGTDLEENMNPKDMDTQEDQSTETESLSILAPAPQKSTDLKEKEEKMEVTGSSQESNASDEVFEKETERPTVSDVYKDKHFTTLWDKVLGSAEEVTVITQNVHREIVEMNNEDDMTAVPESEDILSGKADSDFGDSEGIVESDSIIKETVGSTEVDSERAESTESVAAKENKTCQFKEGEDEIIAQSDEVLEETPIKKKQHPMDYIPSEWSPSKSPSCSILKKPTPSSEKQSRRVSFAEPVVSGESPVREKYHSESLPTSPLIGHTGQGSSDTKFSKSTSSPGKLMHRGTPYRRRLEGSLRKNESLLARHRNSPSQSSSPQSQNNYKATQESQLDAVNPIFPDLVDCKNPLDLILPQLTSSLWHRGLCQLMKGRNMHTIGDLSSLTEVQVNQMPIRHPKVKTVRDSLMTYLNQHGNSRGSKSIFACAATPLDASTFMSPKSTGATLGQAVTPSSIADEGMKILPRIEEDLSQLSPIRDTCATNDEDIPQSEPSQQQALSETTAISSDGEATQSSSCEDNVVSSLSSFISASQTGFKGLGMTDLFDIHQKLNSLLINVVEEMKSRQLNSKEQAK